MARLTEAYARHCARAAEALAAGSLGRAALHARVASDILAAILVLEETA